MFSHRGLGTLTVGDPGDEAQAKRGILKITYPVDHGIVQDAMSPPLCSCDTKLRLLAQFMYQLMMFKVIVYVHI